MDAASDPPRVVMELSFMTTDPYDLIPRILDHARKSSIVIERLTTERRVESFDVVAVLAAPSDAVLETFKHRCTLVQTAILVKQNPV